MKHTIFIDDNGEKSGFYNIDDGESRINSYYYDIDPTTGTLFTSTEVVEIINDMRKAGICAHAIPSVTRAY